MQEITFNTPVFMDKSSVLGFFWCSADLVFFLDHTVYQCFS